jgi:hypothetical protein
MVALVMVPALSTVASTHESRHRRHGPSNHTYLEQAMG